MHEIAVIGAILVMLVNALAALTGLAQYLLGTPTRAFWVAARGGQVVAAVYLIVVAGLAIFGWRPNDNLFWIYALVPPAVGYFAEQLRVVAAEQDPWHPGRCASIRVGDWIVGYAGELHPQVVERLGLPARSAALELDLDALPARATPVAPRISPFPPVHLDLAVVVPAAAAAHDVTAALTTGGGELLESVRLFDVYAGDQVAGGSKSLAFALVIRAADRTLTAAEALQVRDAALAEANARTGATLR